MSASHPIPLKVLDASQELPEKVAARVTPPGVTRPGGEVTSLVAPPSDALQGEDLPTSVSRPSTVKELAIAAGVECFTSQHQRPFAWVPVSKPSPHFECVPLKSKAFVGCLDAIVEASPELAGTQSYSSLRQAAAALELNALRSGSRELETRLAVDGGSNFIDVGDPNWSMIEVNSAEWKVVPQDVPRFFRPVHMKSLAMPVAGGDVEELFDFIPATSVGERILVLAWLLSAFLLRVATPILMLTGMQGSGKTTRSRWLRSLVDPSLIPTIGEIEKSQLPQIFSHHAVPCFENVGAFNRAVANCMCRAVTREGVERRMLYTDADSVIFEFRRAIIINGLGLPSTHTDFLDRCLVMNFTRLDAFQAGQNLEEKFDAARGRLLGAVLDLLVKTLQVIDSVPTRSEFRMADFAHFGRAVAVALGRQTSEFDEAYRANVRQVNREVVEDSTTARLVREFASSYTTAKPWRGIATELLKHLNVVAKRRDFKDARCVLTKSPSKLAKELGGLATALKGEEVVLNKIERTNSRKDWEIFQEATPTTLDVAAIQQRLEGGENV